MKLLAILPLLGIAAAAHIAASLPSPPVPTTSTSSIRSTTPPTATDAGSGSSPSSVLANTPQADLLAMLGPIMGTLPESLHTPIKDAVNAANDGHTPAVETVVDELISALEENVLVVSLILKGIETSRLGELLGGKDGAFHAAVDGLHSNMADIGKMLRELVHSLADH